MLCSCADLKVCPTSKLSRRTFVLGGVAAARRTAAYQAYYENMPLRPANASNGNSIPLFRRVQWGQLAVFHMLDTRQFRNDQACGDGWRVCADADLASRSLPGTAQETWLLDGLGRHLANWDIDQVILGTGGINSDW
jgi:phosphodiesterase/alkaline phosphatase D-like protein